MPTCASFDVSGIFFGAVTSTGGYLLVKITNKRRIALWGLILSFYWATSLAAPIIPAPPVVAANGYLLVDFHSGHVLSEKNASQRMEPASLTKIMSAYVVFQELKANNIRLDERVAISKKAWRMPGSRTFVEVGKQVPLEVLLMGMIVQSGNDATVALAEHIAGSEDVFAAVMNQRAQELGMTGTHFVNSTGLPDPDHYMTARDLVILARATIRDFPEYYKWYAVREYTYNKISQFNRNKMLWRDESVDGVKTGHTQSAGYCLVASALRDDMRLVSVVLGAKGENARAQESQKLLNYGFRFFETYRLYEANEPVTTVRIWKGAADQLPMGLNKELYVTIPRGQYDSLDASVSLPDTISAPASLGQEFGSVNISLGGELLAQRPLVALQQIDEGGIIDRFLDEIMLMLK